jgi:ssDNA-binding Zn-finger/Zn-ribbon topoisomerase 1
MTISVDNKYVRLISGRLRNFKQKKENLYNFSCPLCGDSQKNKLKARGYAYQKGNDLFYRCHNCNAGTNIAGLLKHVDTQLHSEYILERYKSGQDNNSNTISEVLQLSVPKFGKIEKKKVFEHAEWLCNLPEEHFALKYATNRKIPLKFYDKLLFTSHYNQFITTLIPNHGKQILDDARLVIPFYDENNELIAVSGRALETSDKTLRYVTIRTNENQNKLIYGMDRVDLSKRVYLCEGPIDSMFIDNCVASGDANLAMTAKDISAHEIILIFDNEPRNKEIVKMIQTAIKMNHTVVIWPDTIKEKDINAMIMTEKTPDELLNIISSNSFSGIQAQLKFNMWKKV